MNKLIMKISFDYIQDIEKQKKHAIQASGLAEMPIELTEEILIIGTKDLIKRDIDEIFNFNNLAWVENLKIEVKE